MVVGGQGHCQYAYMSIYCGSVYTEEYDNIPYGKTIVRNTNGSQTADVDETWHFSNTYMYNVWLAYM